MTPVNDHAIIVSIRNAETNGIVMDHQLSNGRENIALVVPIGGAAAGWIEKSYTLDDMNFFSHPHTLSRLEIALFHSDSRFDIVKAGERWMLELKLMVRV